ncbi:MAG: hypothetical protein JW944_00960 [Deltaproteobacteria bacterium]|nr:hypothetical protein [Deltaproteobacteria bacterium]
MKPRINPLHVFKNSKTPAGLYACQKWLVESDNGQWKNDFREVVKGLFKNQNKNGSWKESQIEKAFTRLYDSQNEDGTWSDDEPEWNTFLVVHALKNKGFF